MVDKLKGRVWIFGDDLDVDKDLIPQSATGIMQRHFGIPEPEDAKSCMAPLDPDFHKKVRKGDFIVAGKNMGAGHDHYGPQISMKACGIGAVIAESFNWNFYRNAIHLGLPVVPCPGIKQNVKQGDELEVNLRSGVIKNLNTGETIKFKPLPDFLLDMIEAGGSMFQKDISWKMGFSRVKTHRILVRLIRRGVVSSEKYYNTNKITLSEQLTERKE